MKLKKERYNQPIQMDLIDWIKQKEFEQIIKEHVWFDKKEKHK